jgi:hypothetical protein
MGGNRGEPGVVRYFSAGFTEATLVGFGVNSARLEAVHRTWLDDNVVPLLEAGGGLVLVGYASRTGSQAHNARLSAARVSAVSSHLRSQVAARGVIAVSDNLPVNDFAVGETAAAAAGAKDGTEDPQFRAVHVRAWRKPFAPKPPEIAPVVVPVPVKKVVIFRRWTRSDIRQPMEPGESAADLGSALGDMWSPDLGDFRYATVPEDYAVNAVTDALSVDWKPIMGGSDTTYTREITYVWGIRTDDVCLVKKFRQLNISKKWDAPRISLHPRSKIWRHTVSPNAPVAGL